MTAEIAEKRRNDAPISRVCRNFTLEPRHGTIGLGQAFEETKIAVDDAVQAQAYIAFAGPILGRQPEQQHGIGCFRKKAAGEIFDYDLSRQPFRERQGDHNAPRVRPRFISEDRFHCVSIGTAVSEGGLLSSSRLRKSPL